MFTYATKTAAAGSFVEDVGKGRLDPGADYCRHADPSEQATLLEQGGLRATGVPARLARDRLIAACRELPTASRLRWLHRFATMAPVETQETMKGFIGMGFMPSPREAVFRPHPLLAKRAQERGMAPAELLASASPEESVFFEQTGHAVCELADARAVTVAYQQWQKGRYCWRLDVFGFWTDFDGLLRVGDVQPDGYGWRSKHHFWCDLLGAPDEAASPLLGRYASTLETGLGLFAALEDAANGARISNGFSWPRAWMGFAPGQTPPFEGVTQALRNDVVRLVQTWAALDRPPNWHAATDYLESVAGSDRLTSSTRWYGLVDELGKLTCHYLAQTVFEETRVSFDGLDWLPLDYFQAGSQSRPWMPGRHQRMLLTLGERELWGDSFTGSPQVVAVDNRAVGFAKQRRRLIDARDGVKWHLLHKHVPQVDPVTGEAA